MLKHYLWKKDIGVNWWEIYGDAVPFQEDLLDYQEFVAMIGRRQKQLEDMANQKQKAKRR